MARLNVVIMDCLICHRILHLPGSQLTVPIESIS